jgi:hypothetical protein
LRPKRSAAQPEQAKLSVMPTKNAVTTQLIWSWVAEKVPCMWGSTTATLVRWTSNTVAERTTKTSAIVRWTALCAGSPSVVVMACVER